MNEGGVPFRAQVAVQTREISQPFAVFAKFGGSGLMRSRLMRGQARPNRSYTDRHSFRDSESKNYLLLFQKSGR